MELDKETVEKVARVARLELSPEETERFPRQLSDIIHAFSKIDEVDTTDVEMSIQPVKMSDALREDVPRDCLTVDEALRNTEHKKDSFFKGPRAI